MALDISRRFATRLVGVAVALSVALRLPQLRGDIYVDEAEYAHIARQWAHGARLYRDVSLDRPQLLLVLFRGLNRLGYLSSVPLRGFMMAWGAALIVAVAWLVRTAGGSWRAVAATSLLLAWFSSSKFFDGQFVNGELLAALPSVLCLCVGLTAFRRSRRTALLVAAGLLGGVAVLFKQSGIDGFAALCLWTVFGGRPMTKVSDRAKDACRLVGGFGVAIGIAAVHGATLGFSAWVHAMVGARLDQAGSSGSAGLADRLVTSLNDYGPYAVGLAAGVILAAIHLRRTSATTPLLWTWLAMGGAAFLAGGGYSRHYYQALFPAACTLCGLAIDRLWTGHRPAVAMIAGLSVLPLALGGAPMFTGGQSKVYREARRAAQYVKAELPPDERLASLFINHLAPSLADRPVYPLELTTIWQEVLPDRVGPVAATLDGPDRPVAVLVGKFDRWPAAADPVKHALQARYRSAHRVGVYTLFVVK